MHAFLSGLTCLVVIFGATCVEGQVRVRSSRPIGTKVAPAPPVPETGPYSDSGKVAPLPVRDLGAKKKVWIAYHKASDQIFYTGYRPRLTTAAAFINSFFVDAALERNFRRYGTEGDRDKAGLSWVMDPNSPEDVFVLEVNGSFPTSTYVGEIREHETEHQKKERRENQFQLVVADVRAAHASAVAEGKIPPSANGTVLIFTATSRGIEHDSAHMAFLNGGVALTDDLCLSDSHGISIAQQMTILRDLYRSGNIGGSSYKSAAHELGHAIAGLLDRKKVVSQYSVMDYMDGGAGQNFSPAYAPRRPKVQFVDEDLPKLWSSGYLSIPEVVRITSRK